MFGWSGGDLVANFAVGPAPFDAGVAKITGSVTPSTGAATISGVVTCTRTSSFWVNGQLVQKVGQSIVSGYFYGYGSCEPGTEAAWTGTVNYPAGPHAGRSFALLHGGKAGVSLSLSAYDWQYSESVYKGMTAGVLLKGGASPH